MLASVKLLLTLVVDSKFHFPLSGLLKFLIIDEKCHGSGHWRAHGASSTYTCLLICCSDPLPFQFLSNHREACENTRFVDIDFPALIARKCEVTRKNEEFHGLLDLLLSSPKDKASPIQLESKHYMAIGCDLGNTKDLAKALESVMFGDPAVLFIAEVSVAYMEVEAADRLIEFAANYQNAEFCLLEQILPNGPEFPFAAQMLKHLARNNSPLKSVYKYPTLEDQEARFTNLNWPTSLRARSLWDLWSDDSFISSALRKSLSDVEMFDEWEEFALFASHYSLLVTARRVTLPLVPRIQNEIHRPKVSIEETQLRGEAQSSTPQLFSGEQNIPGQNRILHMTQIGELQVPRTHAAVHISSHGYIQHHGGVGAKGRESAVSTYQCWEVVEFQTPDWPGKLTRRMCHTITPFSLGHLLVGGRDAPNRPLQDCWLLNDGVWKRVQDLPIPLYRHGAVETSMGVLVYGGRTTDGKASSEFFLYNEKGWQSVPCDVPPVQGRFGATFTVGINDHGILLGGMGEDGVVLRDFYWWKLLTSPEGAPSLEIFHDKEVTEMAHLRTLFRYGAAARKHPAGLWLVGGIADCGVVPRQYDFATCVLGRRGVTGYRSNSKMNSRLLNKDTSQLPLLVGHNVVWNDIGITVLGGGANCFSFGTVLNKGIYRVLLDDIDVEGRPWPRSATRKLEEQNKIIVGTDDSNNLTTQNASTFEEGTSTGPEENGSSPGYFEKTVQDSVPFVFRGCNLGRCTAYWTPEYLKEKIGSTRKIVVHESETADMSFHHKNFAYTSKSLGEFIDAIIAGKREYLRSLNVTNTSTQPANITKDFPTLALDFTLPAKFNLVQSRLHSSVLRISGPVNMWLHYDVMANVLCQIRGTKKLTLFPPSDISKLHIPHGKSNSEITNVSTALEDGTLTGTSPQTFHLNPGDVLFIPPLWCHTATYTAGMSVAVNLFFRSAGEGVYAAGRDVYGNRDIQAYEDGRRDVAKIGKEMERLMGRFDGKGEDMGVFYRRRLYGELKEKMDVLEKKFYLGS
jgi:tRNA wybutosine-synthesizing protein 4